MNLTTATPAEIDTRLAELDHAEYALERKVEAAAGRVHQALGERLQSEGRGASRRTWWPTTDAEAVTALRAQGDTLIGMMRTAASIVETYDTAAAALAANRAEQAPLHAEFVRRGGWTRFFEVQGGHIHSSQHCQTLHRGRERTRLAWITDMSGRVEADAIAELAAAAHILCSVCFPNAPVVSTTPVPRKTPAEIAAARDAAERKARLEDAKLIGDVDGGPLRVDHSVLRTVRSAEIAAVSALDWAAYARHIGNPNEAVALKREGHARKIAAALAVKNGTTPVAELARLTAKAVAKVRREYGPDVAAAAAAVWTAQAEAAAAAEEPAVVVVEPVRLRTDDAPVAMTSQPQQQHAGRDGMAEATPGRCANDSRPIRPTGTLDANGAPRYTHADDQGGRLCFPHSTDPAMARPADEEAHRGGPVDRWAAADPHPQANCGPLTLPLPAGQQCPTCGAVIPAGPAEVSGDDAALDAAAAGDAGVAEVLALAGAAPTVTVTDPAGLYAMVRDYGTALLAAAGEAGFTPEDAGAHIILRQIAQALGVDTSPDGGAVVPAPRNGDDRERQPRIDD